MSAKEDDGVIVWVTKCWGRQNRPGNEKKIKLFSNKGDFPWSSLMEKEDPYADPKHLIKDFVSLSS